MDYTNANYRLVLETQTATIAINTMVDALLANARQLDTAATERRSASLRIAELVAEIGAF